MGVAGAASKTHPNSKIFWDMLVEGPNLLESPSQLIFKVLTKNGAGVRGLLQSPLGDVTQ